MSTAVLLRAHAFGSSLGLRHPRPQRSHWRTTPGRARSVATAAGAISAAAAGLVDSFASVFTLIHHGASLTAAAAAASTAAVAATGGTTAAAAAAATTTATTTTLAAASTAFMPWWAAIVCGTIAFRVAFTLPVAIVQRRRVLRLAAITPVLRAWEATLQQTSRRRPAPAAAAAPGAAVAGAAEAVAAKDAKAAFERRARALYAAHACHPTATFLLPWVQVPLFFAVSLGVRRLAAAASVPPAAAANAPAALAAAAPSALPDAAFAPLPPTDSLPAAAAAVATNVDGFDCGGVMWFVNLAAPDPTLLLPLAIAALHLANIEAHAATIPSPTIRQRALKFMLQSVSVLMVPVATQVPSGVALYWATSAAFGFVQNIALRRIFNTKKSTENAK
ncbi:Cytochrome c oxidase assembly protein cox18, mitochondrial [Entophlyctis luteolus]|nr:Cytochrome c oxidase assembly protein cox18, mitochondrial [Entophlyctis luteolus]